jgi:hypothetical protein
MKRITLGVLAGVCLFPVSSAAGPLTLGFWQGVAVRYVSTIAGTGQTVLGSSLATNGSGISPAIDGRTFEAYCVDINGPVFDGIGPYTYEATAASMTAWDIHPPPLGRALAGNYVAWLYTELAQDIATADDDVGRTALQMAIWNVLFDTDFSVSADDGDFWISNVGSNDVLSVANGYLGLLNDNLVDASLADATWLQLRLNNSSNSPDVQDFIGPLAMSTTPVPEPGTLVLLASGLVAGGWQRRRRRSAPAKN